MAAMHKVTGNVTAVLRAELQPRSKRKRQTEGHSNHFRDLEAACQQDFWKN